MNSLLDISKDFETIFVSLEKETYKIIIGNHLCDNLGLLLKNNIIFQKLNIVSDNNVAKHHLDYIINGLNQIDIEHNVLLLEAGEKSKNWENLIKVSEWFLKNKIERGDLVIAFGGGVIGDLVGLASSITRRGIKLAQIPTSLLAQVDSSVGGKTAINSKYGKNLIGSFYQPNLVICDTSFLKTLKKRDFLSGFSEVIKYGLLGDKDFFYWLEKNSKKILSLNDDEIIYSIKRSCEIKSRIVEKDEKEKGERALLNLGHTFGHALEADTNYSEKLLHGEGVSIGCVLALKFSNFLGLCSEYEINRAIRFYLKIGMKTKVSDISNYSPNVNNIVNIMYQDKKVNKGKLNLILSKGIGSAFIYENVEKKQIINFLKKEFKF